MLIRLLFSLAIIATLSAMVIRAEELLEARKDDQPAPSVAAAPETSATAAAPAKEGELEVAVAPSEAEANKPEGSETAAAPLESRKQYRRGNSAYGMNNNNNDNNNEDNNNQQQHRRRRAQYGGSQRRYRKQQHHSRSYNNNNNNNNYNENQQLEKIIDSFQQPDRVISLGTRNLGTTYTRSSSARVVKSRNDRYYTRHQTNKVVANLKLIKKKVHTDTRITVKKPLTIDHVNVNQQTRYIKNVYPRLVKVNVERYGTVVKPARLTEVTRTRTASRKTIRHPVQVSRISQTRNLGTRVEYERNLGIRTLAVKLAAPVRYASHVRKQKPYQNEVVIQVNNDYNSDAEYKPQIVRRRYRNNRSRHAAAAAPYQQEESLLDRAAAAQPTIVEAKKQEPIAAETETQPTVEEQRNIGTF